MTARVYRADDDARRTDAVPCALIEAHLRAAPDCGTTHHAGCACHEARRDARDRELTEALRASLARWRAARGRYTPLPHCDVCGVRLAADGTETHDAECAVGRDLRVLGGGAR